MLNWHKTIAFEDRRSGEYYIYIFIYINYIYIYVYTFQRDPSRFFGVAKPCRIRSRGLSPLLDRVHYLKGRGGLQGGSLCVYVDDQRVPLQAVEQLQANRLLGNSAGFLISHANRPSAALERI